MTADHIVGFVLGIPAGATMLMVIVITMDKIDQYKRRKRTPKTILGGPTRRQP